MYITPFAVLDFKCDKVWVIGRERNVLVKCSCELDVGMYYFYLKFKNEYFS